MKKRFLCALLVTVMLIGVIAVATPEAKAESNMTASEELITLIKQFEGFAAMPFWDNKQYSIGYGTYCTAEEAAYYQANGGITVEEADQRLRAHVTTFSNAINSFLNTYGVAMTQQQFDAMVSLSYNCGSGWTTETSGYLHNALKSGATGNDLIYAFSLWSYTNNVPNDGLIKRRLAEANLYLNGVYSTSKPSNYTFVKFNANGGTVDYTVQGYDADVDTNIKVIVCQSYTVTNSDGTADTYTFDGWYTAITGGTKVEVLDGSLSVGATLYAHWKTSDGTVIAPSAPQTTPVGNVQVKVTGSDINVRSGPGTEYTVVGKVTVNDVLTITETYQSGGYLWGKFGENQWIALSYTNYSAVISGNNQSGDNSGSGNSGNTGTQQPAAAVTGTVTVSDHLNIRSGAGTQYEKVGEYAAGTKVTILEQKTVGADLWGRTEDGWISMAYVKLDSVSTGGTSTPPVTDPPVTEPPVTQAPTTEPPVTQTPFASWVGTVQVNDKLTIRSGAGTYNTIKGFLTNGTQVTILEETVVGNVKWGRIEQGWICLDYVVVGVVETPPVTETPGTTTPTAPEETTTADNSVLTGKWTGTVNTTGILYLRREPGSAGEVVGSLVNGTSVAVTQIKAANSKLWGKVDKGWICLDYVTLDSQIAAPAENAAGVTEGTTTVLAEAITMTVNTCSLRIRGGASVTNSIVDYISLGDVVQILELKAIGSAVWGRTESGWVSLKYLKEG